MTLTVDLAPEVQSELARQAAAHGRPVEVYAASLLEQAVHLPAAIRLRQDRLENTLREMAKFSDKILRCPTWRSPGTPDHHFGRPLMAAQ